MTESSDLQHAKYAHTKKHYELNELPHIASEISSFVYSGGFLMFSETSFVIVQVAIL